MAFFVVADVGRRIRLMDAPDPPPYVGGYASIATRHFLYAHTDLFTPESGTHSFADLKLQRTFDTMSA